MNPDIEYVYITDNREAEKVAAFLSTQRRLGYDTETTGLSLVDKVDKLLLMQLGTEEVAYLFDARKINPLILKPILESKDILKIAHNCKFEHQVTLTQAGARLRNVFDTMLAYRLLTSGLLPDGKGSFVPAGFRDKGKKTFPYKSLNFLTEEYLGITLDKSVRSGFAGALYRDFTKTQLEYAAQDVLVLHPLCDLLGAQLADEELIETALLEFEFVGPVSEMELAGVCLDEARWRQVIMQAQKQAKNFVQKMVPYLAEVAEQNMLFGELPININSPEQVLGAFRRLGYDLEDTKDKSLKEVDHELARLLLDYRAYNKLVSTYGEAILKKVNRTTGRLHFKLHQLGADTGRLSSEDPNIQNIPNDKEDQDAEVAISFRDCFVAPAEKSMLTADFSQCIAADELVATAGGFVEMDCFDPDTHPVPGMEFGMPVNADGHVQKGTKETVEVFTVDGFSVRCTSDHRIKVVDRKGQEYWKRADALTSEDYLVLSRDWIVDSGYRGVVLHNNEEEACELLGYWVGDGSFSSGGVSFARSDPGKYPGMYHELQWRCYEVFGKELKEYEGTTGWDLIGRDVQKWFEDRGCRRDWKSPTKEVPASIREGGSKHVSSFLRGLFEAGGWVVSNPTNNVVAFSSRSERLAKQVQLLLLGLGIFSKRAAYSETTTVGGRTYEGIQHHVSICDGLNCARFRERVGFISAEKNEILDAVPEDRVAYADYVVVDEGAFDSWVVDLSASRRDWPNIRRKWVANYYNSNKGMIKPYTRSKLSEFLSKYGQGASSILPNNLAFSRFSHTEGRDSCEVFDISVPGQNAFVAGGVFVHNCELRILAEVSQDPKFLEIFRNNQDLHIITSQQVFGYSDAELDAFFKVKKQDGPDANLLDLFSAEEVAAYKRVSDFRSKTKAINFGVVYGLSAWSLMQRYKIPKSEAETILDNYFKTYSGIKRWLDTNARETVANRYAKTILGRKKYFFMPSPDDEEAFRRSKGAVRRMGNNHAIQGCNADITKRALVDLCEAYQEIEGARALFTVHDEIVSECYEKDAQRVAELKANVMRDAFHVFIKTVPVGPEDRVSVSIAKHWSK